LTDFVIYLFILFYFILNYFSNSESDIEKYRAHDERQERQERQEEEEVVVAAGPIKETVRYLFLLLPFTP